jgi:hypothetical protein
LSSVEVPEGAPLAVKIAVPDRGLVAETTINSDATPHLRVNVAGSSLVVRPEAVPPRFA